MTDRLRVGFVGAGAISQYHLAGRAQMPDAKLAAICDVDEARGAGQGPGLRHSRDLRRLPRDDRA